MAISHVDEMEFIYLVLFISRLSIYFKKSIPKAATNETNTMQKQY